MVYLEEFQLPNEEQQARFLAGEISGDDLFIGCLDCLFRCINLGKQTSQQFLIDFPVITESHHAPQPQQSRRDTEDPQDSGYLERQNGPRQQGEIGQSQQDGGQQPGPFF